MALHYNLKECNLKDVPDNIVTEMIYLTMVIQMCIRDSLITMNPKHLNQYLLIWIY